MIYLSSQSLGYMNRHLKVLPLFVVLVSLTVFAQQNHSPAKGATLRDKNLSLIYEDDKAQFYLISSSIKAFPDNANAFSFDVQRDYKIADKDHPEDIGLKEHFLAMCDSGTLSSPLIYHLRSDGLLGKIEPVEQNKGMRKPEASGYQRKAMDYVCMSQLGEKYGKAASSGQPIFRGEINTPTANVPASKETISTKISSPSSPPIFVPIDKLTFVYQPDSDAYYPSYSKKNGEQGAVAFRLTFDEVGGIEDISLIQSSLIPRLDSAGFQIGKRYRIKPYLIDGKPTKVSTNLLIKFVLKN